MAPLPIDPHIFSRYPPSTRNPSDREPERPVTDDRTRCPSVGIIMLDTRFPRIPGDVGNPQTFPFAVRYHRVAGASPKRVVRAADPGLLEPFIRAARTLVRAGVRAIATSCGFLAIYQRQLAAAVSVPVFSSALLQIGLARAATGGGRCVGIITADRDALSAEHFSGVGIDRMPEAIVGMAPDSEFAAVFLKGKPTLDAVRCRQEVVAAAASLLHDHPHVGSIVLECTNMPPYAAAVQAATGLPVFDVVSLIHLAHRATVQTGYPASSG